MNRTLKRPMFRIGGSAGTGITSGLSQPQKMANGGRTGYANGTPSFQATGLPGFLTQFGLNLLSTPPQGNIFQTAAVSAQDPFRRLQASQAAAASTAEDRAFKEKFKVPKSEIPKVAKIFNEAKKDASKMNKKFQELAESEEYLLSITENGYGKLSSAYEYRISNRGGKGITGIMTSEKNGEVVDCFVVKDNDEIILVSDKGQIIRVNVNQIRIAGRSTKGVSIFKIPESDRIVSVSRIQEFENDE